MSFISAQDLREIGLKSRPADGPEWRSDTRNDCCKEAKSRLGREGTSQAANFPELRNEIVALKKLEQEQKREVALRIAQIEEGIKQHRGAAARATCSKSKTKRFQSWKLEKKPILQRRNDAKNAAELCEREVSAVERRIQENDA